MTTAQFIQKQFRNADGKDKWHSSIWKDGQGNLYSYGRHYPLLFEIDGVTFVNAVGYSNTTARHISHARGAASSYVNLWVSGCNQYTWNNPENSGKIPSLMHLANYGMTPVLKKALKKAALADLVAELANINERVASKKRTDTKIYAGLMDELADCTDRLAEVRSAWGIK